MKDGAFWTLMGLIVCLICGAYAVYDCSGCESRGGAYVESASGWYVCVEKKP